MRYFFVLFLLAWLTTSAQKNEKPYVILISFDGFRYDYTSKFELPNFTAFVKNGAAADGLIPSFPSKTFPNHYTLVTGLYPGHHGLVDNYFYDKTLDLNYSMRNRTMVENPVFYGGIPLWQLAQQQGLKSASCFWVGSEAPVQGEFPTYYFRYDESVSNTKRVDQVLTWLKLRKKDRPKFISLYFSLVDSEGHNTGPNSEELKKTVLEADSLLGYLMRGLKKIRLPVNVILVSDHGMYELEQKEGTYITLSKFLNLADTTVRVINGGTQAHLYTKNVDSLYNILKSVETNFEIFKREDFPDRWNYRNDRVGDIMIVAKPGYYIQMNSRHFGRLQSPVFGVHGYDPDEVKEMQGIFYANGPNIKAGITLPVFKNIHVYPFVAYLLGLTPPKTDGSLSVLLPVYKN
ncbi:MAG: alkaline phosphatase family protein [Cyclobacteriaceae bacterium]|nr:alkaline phosphatase family protein [Cyclobacteriaceae bacterium]UYN86828.1 MAG: alkaline phosphatase family protein [Cyclobacteriaceae bacterium]